MSRMLPAIEEYRKKGEIADIPGITAAKFLMATILGYFYAVFVAGVDFPNDHPEGDAEYLMPFDYGDYIGDWTAKEPLSHENGIYESYLPSHEGWGENSFSVIQLDAHGKLIECPVFTSGETGYINKTMMLLCDIDGDGQPELLTMRASIYAPIIVYKMMDGKPVEVFRIATGA